VRVSFCPKEERGDWDFSWLGLFFHSLCESWLTVWAEKDPKYEDEVSGCTASVGIITHDKIYVVST